MTHTAAQVSVFIYFKVNQDDDDRVLASMRAHRMALQAEGVDLRFWRRADKAPSGQTTWMETCSPVDCTLALLQEKLARSALATGLLALAQGVRHVEVFEQVEP